MAGRTKGPLQGSLPRSGSLDQAAWQEPDQTQRQECASCSPRNGRNAAPLSSQEGGSGCSSGPCPAARQPPNCQGKAPRYAHLFIQGSRAKGRHGPGVCCVPGAW